MRKQMQIKKLIVHGVAVLGLAALVATGGSEASAKKRVLPKKIKTTGNTLKQSEMLVKLKEKEKIGYTVKPKKAANKKVTFTSSNKKVARVNAKGVVTGVSEGKATITLRSKVKKSVKAKMKVTVTSGKAALPVYYAGSEMPVPTIDVIDNTVNTYYASSSAITQLTLNQTKLEMEAGDRDHLTATVVPAAANVTIKWSSNHIGGINVYQNGDIYVTDDTPPGTEAVITASCSGLSASCTVVVVQGACPHTTWGDWQNVLAPTCTVEGIRRQQCNNCTKTREEAVPATGHSWVSKTVQEPTCTEAGLREDTCSACGEVKQIVVPPKGHTWNTNGEVITEPTCTKKGEIKYTCSATDCGGEKIEAIPAKGHIWDSGEKTKDPTCTGRGQMIYHCSVEGCTGTRNVAIPATGHTWTYGEITQEPTCLEKGKRICECLICSSKRTEDIDALGHDWNDGVREEPTCTKKGRITYSCKKCAATKYEVIPANGHTFDYNEELTVDQEPTCLERGWKSRHCKVPGCDGKIEVTLIPATGHQFYSVDELDDLVKKGTIPEADRESYIKVTVEPKCTSPGLRFKYCAHTEKDPSTGQRVRCDAVKRELLSATGHAWTEDFVVDEYPTCTKPGQESLHCTVCNKIKNIQLIPSKGHDWDRANGVRVEPTCIQEGSLTSSCIRKLDVPETDDDGTILRNPDGSIKTKQVTGCGGKRIEVLEPLGHDYDSVVTDDVVATCVKPGQKSRHCRGKYRKKDGTMIPCDSLADVTLVKPAGHTWSGSWTQIQAPAHGIPGLEERLCTVTGCNGRQTRAVMDPHDYDENGQCQKCGDSVSLTTTDAKDWEYRIDETANTVLLKKYIGTKKDIRIPATMKVTVDRVTKDYDVEFAGGYEERPQAGVFASNTRCQITSVSFEDGVNIPDMQYMFSGCKELKQIFHIPASVANVNGAFKNCTSLTYVCALPEGLTELRGTFDGCSSLKEVPEIPDYVTSLYAAYKGCSSLCQAPEIPEGVTDMKWTFSGCARISQAPKLPTTLVDMTNTFENCTSLQEVPKDIPSGVVKLTMTFYGCNSLEMVPALPTSIEVMERTFANCKNLTYAEPLPAFLESAVAVFEGCDNLG